MFIWRFNVKFIDLSYCSKLLLFQKTENGWREVLIDLDPDNPLKFRYVISRMATPASAMFVKVGLTEL